MRDRGMKNANRRFLVPGFSFSLPTQMRIVRAIVSWMILELTEGWRTWFRSSNAGTVPESERTENEFAPPRSPDLSAAPAIPKTAQPTQ